MKRKVIAIFTVMVIIVSIFSMSVSAEINTSVSYPFPNCSSLVKDKEYLIYQTPNLASYRLLVWNKGEQLYLKNMSHKPTEWYLSKFSAPQAVGQQNIDGIENYNYDSFLVRYDIIDNQWVKANVPLFYFPLATLKVTSWSSQSIQKVPYEGSGQPVIFFQQAPLQMSILSGALKEVRSLIPYLVVFLIGLVAFWKGWQFLSTQLRKA